MYKLSGEIEFEDGLKLVNPNWKIETYIDCPHSFTIPSINVKFWMDGYFSHIRTFQVEMDYTEAGTYEDQDLYNALLQLPQLGSSELI